MPGFRAGLEEAVQWARSSIHCTRKQLNSSRKPWQVKSGIFVFSGVTEASTMMHAPSGGARPPTPHLSTQDSSVVAREPCKLSSCAYTRCVATGLEAYLIHRDFALDFIEHCGNPPYRMHIDHAFVRCTSRLYAPSKLLTVQEPSCACCKKSPEIMKAMQVVATSVAAIFPVATRPSLMPELEVWLKDGRDFASRPRPAWVIRMEAKAIGAIMSTFVFLVLWITMFVNQCLSIVERASSSFRQRALPEVRRKQRLCR